MAWAGVVSFAMPADVAAQDATWTGPGNEWTTSSNWDAATVPTDTANFTTNGAPTSVTISSNASIGTLDFDAAAPAYTFTVRNAATFSITNGTTSGSSLLPAFRVDAGATLRIDDLAFVQIDTLADGASGGGAVVVGPPGSTFALLSINGDNNATFSGTVSGTGGLELNGSGITTLTGASNGGNIGTLAGDVTLCNCGPGGLTISSGSLTVEGFMGVAVEGGTLSVVNGGSLRVTNGDLLVASNMVVSGSGSNVTVAGLTGVGIFGPATLTIGDGGTLTSQSGVEIDALFGGTPTATVSGPGSTWNIGFGLAVGGGSTGGLGALTVASGGTVNVGGPMTIGDAIDGSSAALVTGAGSVVNVTGPLVIGDPCDCLVGTLTVADGGVVNAPGSTSIGQGSTLNLGLGGLGGAIVTPSIINEGQIVANFIDTLVLTADISDIGTLSKAGTGTLILTGNNTYTGGTTVTGGLINFMAGNLGTGTIALNGGGLQWAAGNTSDISGQLAAIGTGGATFDTNGNNVSFATALTGSGGLTKAGNGTLTLAAINSYVGNTTINGGTLAVVSDATLGAASGGLAFGGGTLQLLGAFTSARAITLNAAGGTVDTNGNNATLSGAIGGTDGLTKAGAGTLALSGASSYAGATNVNAGVLQAAATNAFSSASTFTVASGATLDLNGLNQTIGALGGAGGVTLGAALLTAGANNTSTTFSGTIGGTGGFTKTGTGVLNLTGANTYSGPTNVNAGTLLVNGSLAGGVTVNSGGILGGSGQVGTLVASGGTIAPGNSIGTLTVAGNFTQNGGIYQVEVNGAGQSDRINVTGAAILNGGTVQVVAQTGTRGATYTILNATGGVSGAYSGATSNFAFLRPALTYDANNVYLTMFQSFASGAQTNNQYAVGLALDQASASATGDFDNVLNALNALSAQQGPAALNAISGQQYADFGTTNIQGGYLFTNVVGQQMAVARGSAGGGQRLALAQACDVEACDGVSPWSVWASALGGLGSVAGNGNSSTLTYNFGGAAAGVDYRFDPRFLVGLSAGYAAGNQWVDSFMGRGWTDTVSVMAYGSFTPSGALAGFYADALAGYAYSGNQMQRQIQFPGLQRTANGSTGANQFLGQVETGYRIGIFAPAAASITPFARLQGSTVSQNAFTEWGANSLSLNVAQQTTNSLRTVFGADLAGVVPLGSARSLALDLRLGWLHEYANTGRPITAAFAGAPSNSFTVYGATPQRDAAVIGFSAGTSLAEATQLYLRYDGEISTGANNHTLNLGLRISW